MLLFQDYPATPIALPSRSHTRKLGLTDVIRLIVLGVVLTQVTRNFGESGGKSRGGLNRGVMDDDGEAAVSRGGDLGSNEYKSLSSAPVSLPVHKCLEHRGAQIPVSTKRSYTWNGKGRFN